MKGSAALQGLLFSLAIGLPLAATASPYNFGNSNPAYSAEGRAYYGDPANDLLYVIDVDDMSLAKVIATGAGSKPYPVDGTNDEKTYVSTRGVQSVSVLNNFDIDELLYQIPLSHTPRSTTYNASKGMALISGGDVPMSTAIRVNKDKVKTVVGGGPGWDSGVNTDFGGSNATGHPFWHRNKQFFLLNRVQRRIELYKSNGTLLDSLDTGTTAHHLLRAPDASRGKQRSYFVSLEGNPLAGIAPGVMRFEVDKRGRMRETGRVQLACDSCNVTQMGGHHADIDPAGEYIYMGSNEGHMFIIDIDTLDIVATIDSGAGSGHTRFIASRSLAVVTNHNDGHMTLIDTDALSKIANVPVAGCGIPGRKWQGHTTGISPDQRYFYGVASCEGKFFRIDLDSLAVSYLDVTAAALAEGASLPTGTAYPIQGAKYLWN